MHLTSFLTRFVAISTVLVLPCFACDEATVTRATSTAAGVRALAASRQSPAELVRTAFDQAAAGDTSHWNDYLTKAIEADPDFAPARWQAGYLRHGDRWLTIDEAARLARENELLTSYRQMRIACPDTAAGHLRLAHWCLNNGLKDEERAHLIQVLLKEPNNSDAHVALGDRLIRGVWISADSLEQAKQRQQRVRESILRWTSDLNEIRQRLEDKDLKRRDDGRSRLLALADPSVIPAFERIFSLRSQALAGEVLNALKRMDDPDATASIARHAVFASWPDVRDIAAKQLKERPFDHFVPLLVDTLRSPINSQYVIIVGADGRPLYEHVLYREGFEVDEQVVLNNKYVRSSRVVGPAMTKLAIDRINRQITARERSIEIQNSQSSALNERIIGALTTATGADLGSEPSSWWQWWGDYNGLYYVHDERPAINQYYTQYYTIRQPTSCFVAGTPVWTSNGPTPIEQVRPGDRVLAQDAETGELARKPVLRTTVRPPGPLLSITADTDSIAATEGHPFWVNGTGWVVARGIKEGDFLYRVGGGHPVQSIVANLDEQATYNLVVADFHTYFIGEGKLLVHDNSIRKPTAAKVPGQR